MENLSWDLQFKKMIDSLRNIFDERAKNDLFGAIDALRNQKEPHPLRGLMVNTMKMALLIIALALQDTRVTTICNSISRDMESEEVLSQSKAASC